jgi:dienelactone hydrolase
MCHPEIPVGTPIPQVRTQEVAIELDSGERLPGLLALPERTPAPVVLVVNDVFGRSDFYEHLTRRIAQAGHIALDVEFFFREGMVAPGDRAAAQERRGRLDHSRALDDLDAAIAWLQERSDVRGPRVGTIGFCMGGTFVLQLAARRAHLATVSYYGFPAARGASVRSPVELADDMHGPILGHWGDQDAGVGMENVQALDEKLTSGGVDHTFHVYPGLGHGFLKALLDDEGAPSHDLACQSWIRTLDFWSGELAG